MELNYFHIQIIIFLVSLTLGYVVWTYNSKSYLNRILTLIIICILLIDISLLFYLKIEGRRFLLATIILGSVGISFFTPLFYTLSLYYPVKKKLIRKHLILVYGISLVLSMLIVASFPKDYIIDKALFTTTLHSFSLKDLPLAFAMLYFLLTSFSIGLLLLSAKNFLSSFRGKIIPYEKNTVRMLTAIGVPLAYLLSIVNVINFFFNIPFPWIGFFLATFTLFIVILIFRFHIVDLKRLINGILFYPSLIAILVFIYISLILRNQNRIAQILALPESIALILEVFIIYLAVSTLRRLFDISFIKKRFRNVSAFKASDIEPLEYLSYALTVKDLYKRLREVFRAYSKTENMMMLILDKENQNYINVDRQYSFEIRASSELVKILLEINRGVTLEELLIHMNDRDDIKLLHGFNVNLILPITRGDKIVALILLPKRGIIQRWSYEDIGSLNYLKVIIPPLIDRCNMYENEKEIEKHQYRMEQFVVMGQMASGLAHEIRNPLSIISTSVETIMKNQIKERDKIRMLRYIQDETDRINLLANKLLSINVQKKPELESVNLTSIFHKLSSFLKYKLKDRGISFSVKNGDTLYFYSDSNLLFQIFLNLALNSIEAINRGGRIDVDYKRDHDSVTIVMKDDGPGIPSRIREKIYEPFYTTKKNGSGLGLTVTKNLVENLYGNIKLIPTKSGACFEILLPVLKIRE